MGLLITKEVLEKCLTDDFAKEFVINKLIAYSEHSVRLMVDVCPAAQVNVTLNDIERARRNEEIEL